MEYQCTDEDALSHDGLIEGESMHERENVREIEGIAPGDTLDEPDSSQHPVSQPDSSQPQASQTSQAGDTDDEEPEGYKNRRRAIPFIYNENSLSDASRFPLPMERFYHPNHLLVVENREYFESIASQSKSFGMVYPKDHPIYAGPSWSFVDLCTSPNLSEYMIRVIDLFSKINALSYNYSWKGHTVPTMDIETTPSARLKPIYDLNGKDIKGVMLQEMIEKGEERASKGPFDEILLADDASELAEGDAHKSLPFLSISVGFTAAVFHNERAGKEEVALFGVVRVTTLLNVDAFDFIIVSPSRPASGRP